MNTDSFERVKSQDGGSWGRTVGIVRKGTLKNCFVLVPCLLTWPTVSSRKGSFLFEC